MILVFYNPMIIREIESLGAYIKHKRDENFTYAGLRQVADKYSVQDRSSAKSFEIPFMYMMIAATLFANYPKEDRMYYVRRYYDAIPFLKINIPTPVMAGVERQRQFARVLVDSDDILDSIPQAICLLVGTQRKEQVSESNAGRNEAPNAKIRGGEVAHTGIIPFLRSLKQL